MAEIFFKIFLVVLIMLAAGVLALRLSRWFELTANADSTGKETENMEIRVFDAEDTGEEIASASHLGVFTSPENGPSLMITGPEEYGVMVRIAVDNEVLLETGPKEDYGLIVIFAEYSTYAQLCDGEHTVYVNMYTENDIAQTWFAEFQTSFSGDDV